MGANKKSVLKMNGTPKNKTLCLTRGGAEVSAEFRVLPVS